MCSAHCAFLRCASSEAEKKHKHTGHRKKLIQNNIVLMLIELARLLYTFAHFWFSFAIYQTDDNILRYKFTKLTIN